MMGFCVVYVYMYGGVFVWCMCICMMGFLCGVCVYVITLVRSYHVPFATYTPSARPHGSQTELLATRPPWVLIEEAYYPPKPVPTFCSIRPLGRVDMGLRPKISLL